MTGQQKPLENESPAERLDIPFALKAAQLGVWKFDPTTNVVNWDDQCRALFGLAADNQLPYEEAIRYIHPEDVNRVDQAVKWAMNPESDGAYNLTYRTIGADDGLLRWVRFTGRCHFDETGAVSRFAGIAQDVTKNVRTQQVAASEERFQSLVREASVATGLFTGREMTIEIANDAMIKVLGKGSSVLGKPLEKAVPELKGQPFLQLLDDVFVTGNTYQAKADRAELEVDGVRSDYYFDFTYKALRNANREVYGVMAVAVDVTEQVLSRRKVEESEARFRSLVEESPVATCLFVGRELAIDVANESMISFFGRGPSIRGKPVREVLAAAGDQSAIALLEQVFTTGNPFSATAAPANLTIDGVPGTYYFDLSLKPLRNAVGDVYAILETATNVTQQVLARRAIEASEERYRILSDNLEIQVRERTEELEVVNEELTATNEELAATNEEMTVTNQELIESNNLLVRSNDNLQKFAYVASHDLQEPLRKIQSFGDLLKNQYADALGEGVVYLERMQSAANRMSTLIRDLLSFSRISTQRDTSAPVSLDEVLETVLTELDFVIAETGATVAVGPLPTLVGDASQLRQLFQNLLSNALKFRRAGVPPIITISHRLVAAAALPPTVHPTRAATSYHRIDVTDNGIGFDDKYVDRIFQVFQRLHSRNEFAGTGIGLAICEKVAANHGGAITATSQSGQGATFSLYLPR